MKLENELTLDFQVAELMGRVDALENGHKPAKEETPKSEETPKPSENTATPEVGAKGPQGDKVPAGDPGSYDDLPLRNLILGLETKIQTLESKNQEFETRIKALENRGDHL